MRLLTKVPSPHDLIVGVTLNPSSLCHSLLHNKGHTAVAVVISIKILSVDVIFN